MMQSVKYCCCLAILFASCRATRQTILPPVDETPRVIAYTVSPHAVQPAAVPTEPEVQPEAALVTNSQETLPATKVAPAVTPATRKVSSFAQMKEMARSGEITMRKKDVKVLNKLEKHYKGNFQKFRSEAFEFTDKAKIIAGVGILGLLLAIFAGSWFGAFLFTLAVLAFILRYLDVIAF